MNHLPHAAIMLLSGLTIPILAALNAQLGARLGSPAVAAAVLFAVCLVCTVAVALVTRTDAWPEAVSQPRHLYLAGVFVAFYILSITWIAPSFGVGNAVFFVLLGQLISAAVVDHFGLLGARPAEISLPRAAGLVLMALGVLLTQKA